MNPIRTRLAVTLLATILILTAGLLALYGPRGETLLCADQSPALTPSCR